MAFNFLFLWRFLKSRLYTLCKFWSSYPGLSPYSVDDGIPLRFAYSNFECARAFLTLLRCGYYVCNCPKLLVENFSFKMSLPKKLKKKIKKYRSEKLDPLIPDLEKLESFFKVPNSSDSRYWLFGCFAILSH